MTERELRVKVVNIAKSLLGRKVSDGSHRVIIDGYNSMRPLPRNYTARYDDAWCAMFVSYVGQQAGLSNIIFRECGCGQMIQLYQAAGRWQENDAYVPQIGDIIMYDWDDSGRGDCTGWPDHVGVVAGVAAGAIKVIEGNYNNAVRERTLAVNSRYIRGYCLPDYASAADGTPSAGQAPVVSGPAVDITYQVYAGGRWLPPVRNLEDYAGIEGLPIKGFAICGVSAGRAKYRVHSSLGWHNWIWTDNFDLANIETGFAGDLVHDIDAIQVYYYTPDSIRPYKEAVYRVDTVRRRSYYAWQTDTDTDDGQDGYAGVLGGAAIDRVQMVIR